MDIGSLTGQIELNDQMSDVLVKVNKLLNQFESQATSSMDKAASSMTMAAGVGSFLGNILAETAMKAVSWGKDLVTSSLMAGARLE